MIASEGKTSIPSATRWGGSGSAVALERDLGAGGAERGAAAAPCSPRAAEPQEN